MMSFVRGETSCDFEEESCSSGSTFYGSRSVHIKGKSRRNKHQRPSIGRKARSRDSLPLQKCVFAANDNRIQSKSKSCYELDFAKDNRFEKYREKKETKAEFVPIKVDAYKKSWEKENQVLGSKEEMMEKPVEFQVRGPPFIKSECDNEKSAKYDSDSMRHDKDYGNEEKCKDWKITEYDRQSTKSIKKERKQEMNLLMSEKKAEKVGILQRSLKKPEKDQMSKYEKLMGSSDRHESSKEANSEEEFEKDICYQKEVFDGKRILDEGLIGSEKSCFKTLCLIEKEGPERRVKQVAENGVTCYYDNRYAEEREKDETSSKQRLESIDYQVGEKDDSRTEKFSSVENMRQPEQICVSSEVSYNTPTENSWLESLHNSHDGSLAENTLILKSGCSLDLSTLRPAETRGIVTQEERKLFDCFMKAAKAVKDQINTTLAKPKDQVIMKSLETDECVDSDSNKSETDENVLEDKYTKDVDEKEETEPECGDNAEELDENNTEECIDSEEKDDWDVDCGECCSLKVYSWARTQELEEMKVAFGKLEEKATDLTMNMQTKLEELCGVLKSLDRQGSKTKKCQTVMHEAGQLFARRRKGPLICAKRPRKEGWYDSGGDGLITAENHRFRKRQWEINNYRGGRQCSSAGANESGGSSQSGGKNDTSKNGGGSGGSSNGNYGNGQGNHGNRDTGGGGDGNDRYPRGNKTPEDADVPAYDPKRHRKKHQKIDSNAAMEFLGMLSLETKDGPICQIDNKDVTWCVALGLLSPDDPSEEMMSCFMCININQLLKHYADCSAQYKGCSMCVQVFSLICSHVTDCMNNNFAEEPCTISLCINVKLMMDDNSLSSHMKTLWFHVRKKLARLIGSVDEPDFSRTEEIVMANKSSQRLSSVSKPSLASIPENAMAPMPTGSASNSRVLCRKRSNLANLQEQTEQPSAEHSEGREQSSETDQPSQSDYAPVIYTRGETDYMGGEPEMLISEGSSGSLIDRVTEPPPYRPTKNKFMSMPHVGGNIGENYYPSLRDIVMGIKGIGEVVYGDKSMIEVVADFWLRLKDKYTESGSLARHYREEGVILDACKSNLKIQGIRYSCQFQWIKHNPLGNGMSGKCHLASDFDTNFKFCVKEIHISNYEKEEIELWCDLDHPNIVKVYGAIRHGETIYILQELVEGGNLTEAINTQKALNRRLSQVTALAYFRQLLQVLVYLKSKNILHEDLKADNILLKQDKGSVSIKVTDFGLARRCALNIGKGTKPAGTQTQWSPEKSEGVGYGYPAEVWAVVCVLVHMLSGYPPWIRRFEHSKTLMFLIVKKSPPVEDIPRNIDDVVRDMIERGFTVCQNTRPQAADMLNHRAFRLLDEASNGKEVSMYFSNLPISLCPIDDDPNADLREIFRNLEKERNKKEPAPESPQTYTVYTLHGQEQGPPPPTTVISINNHTSASNDATQSVEMSPSNVGVSGPTRVTHTPGVIDNNTIDQYLTDPTPTGPPPPLRCDMTIYNPDYETSDDESEKNKTPTDHQTIMKELLPVFSKLGIDDSTRSDNETDEEDKYEVENMFENFNLDEQIKKMGINSSGLFNENPGGGKGLITSTPEDKSDGGSLFFDDKYDNIDDEDELFKSGPNDETHTNGGHLKKVSLFKSRRENISVPRTLVVLPPDQNPSSATPHNPQPSLSLAPYLVNRDSPNYLNPHRNVVPQKLSPEIGPPEPKMLKFDFGNAVDSGYMHGTQQSMQRRNPNQVVGGGITFSDVGGSASEGVNERVFESSAAEKTGSSRSKKEEKDDDNQKKKDLHYTGESSHNTGAKAQPLYLDVDRAQRGMALPTTTTAQTAPVISPPRSQPRAEYKRTESEKAPPKSQMHKSQSTSSTSQFELQEAAYKELEDAYSQHSDHSHLLNLTNDDFDDEEPHAEFNLDLENPPESIAHYMAAESPSAWVKVTFVNQALDLKRTMKFPAKSRGMTWENVIDEEFSRQTDLYSNCERVCLRFSEGTVVDLDDCLGEVDVTVVVTEATDEDRWWMEKGMIMKS